MNEDLDDERTGNPDGITAVLSRLCLTGDHLECTGCAERPDGLTVSCECTCHGCTCHGWTGQ